MAGVLVVAALAWAGAMPRAAKGDLTYTTVAGSDSDGPLAATVVITPFNGGIELKVTNTETGTFAKGQAISSLSFTVGGGLSTPTFFTEFKGVSFSPTANGSWTLASGTAFDNTSSASPPNAIDHWGFQPTGSSVSLATAGSPVPGAGNPHFMLLPSTGTAGSGKSLANSNFDPYEIGPGTFFLTDPGVTATTLLTTADFTDVKVGFGTGPDKFLGTTGSGSSGGRSGGPSSVPEPSSMTIVLGCCALGFVASRVRRRLSTGK
jgi:hypothetical protein